MFQNHSFILKLDMIKNLTFTISSLGVISQWYSKNFSLKINGHLKKGKIK